MFEEKDLTKLSKLCHIQMDEKEEAKLLRSLKEILIYIQQLKEVDTSDVAPCRQVLENLSNVMREDEIGQTLSRETFLSNAPDHIGGMVRVPTIFKS